MTNTMRRIKSYRDGTATRKAGITFQNKQLRYLVQPNKHPLRIKKKRMAGK